MLTERPWDSSPSIGIVLTAEERKLILDSLPPLSSALEECFQTTAVGDPLFLTLDQLAELSGGILLQDFSDADAAQEAKWRVLYEKLANCIRDCIQELPPDEQDRVDQSHAEYFLDHQSAVLASVQRTAIAQEPLPHFQLTPTQRTLLRELPELDKSLKVKLAKSNTVYTVGDGLAMAMAILGCLRTTHPREHTALSQLQQKIIEHLEPVLGDALLGDDEEDPSDYESRQPTEAYYQFKISLDNVKPPIWRRIQIHDCTLNDLHYYIQDAMGWEDAHLHEFQIKGVRYIDVERMDGGFGGEAFDTFEALISDILPTRKSKKPFTFRYEYDFGDSWKHTIEFEGAISPDPNVTYPRCTAGQRACPPEDCGGPWSYMGLTEAGDWEDWFGEDHDPEAFDPQQATAALQRGGDEDYDDEDDEEYDDEDA